MKSRNVCVSRPNLPWRYHFEDLKFGIMAVAILFFCLSFVCFVFSGFLEPKLAIWDSGGLPHLYPDWIWLRNGFHTVLGTLALCQLVHCATIATVVQSLFLLACPLVNGAFLFGGFCLAAPFLNLFVFTLNQDQEPSEGNSGICQPKSVPLVNSMEFVKRYFKACSDGMRSFHCIILTAGVCAVSFIRHKQPMYQLCRR